MNMKKIYLLGAVAVVYLCFPFRLRAADDLLLADFEMDSELLDLTVLNGMLIERSMDFPSSGNFSLKMTYPVYKDRNPVLLCGGNLKDKNLLAYQVITFDIYNPQETDISATFVANVLPADGKKKSVWAKGLLFKAKQTSNIVVPTEEIFDQFSRVMSKESKADSVGKELKIENFFIFVSSRFYKEKSLILYLDNLWLKGYTEQDKGTDNE
jgi:hypothetical protein